MSTRRKWIEYVAGLSIAWASPLLVIWKFPGVLDDLASWGQVMNSVPSLVRLWVFGLPLLGLFIMLHAAWWDFKERVMGARQRCEMSMEEVLNYVLDEKKLSGRMSGSELFKILQQQARDGDLTVYARVGVTGVPSWDRKYDIGAFEYVPPEAFRLHGFETDGQRDGLIWAIRPNRKDGETYYYDPMFNRSEIKKLAKRLSKKSL